MKRGAIRQITWDRPSTHEVREQRFITTLKGGEAPSVKREAVRAVELTPVGPKITPAPRSAVEEAEMLLRIAAEVEGALLVQYLYAAYSILPDLSVPGVDPLIESNDWYDVIRQIARQEMGHLVTVQNLLLALNAVPHLDRENLPWIDTGLYPCPF